MSENIHTPVTFWLQLPLRQLLLWIKDENQIIEERNERMQRHRRR
jgi:hypothetical protein